MPWVERGAINCPVCDLEMRIFTRTTSPEATKYWHCKGGCTEMAGPPRCLECEGTMARRLSSKPQFNGQPFWYCAGEIHGGIPLRQPGRWAVNF